EGPRGGGEGGLGPDRAPPHPCVLRSLSGEEEGEPWRPVRPRAPTRASDRLLAARERRQRRRQLVARRGRHGEALREMRPPQGGRGAQVEEAELRVLGETASVTGHLLVERARRSRGKGQQRRRGRRVGGPAA